MHRTPTAKIFIDGEINSALTRAGLPHDRPIREALELVADVVDSYGAYFVRIPDESGDSVSLDDKIAQLKEDPRFRDSAPNQPRVLASDAETIRRNFDKIARGDVIVW